MQRVRLAIVLSFVALFGLTVRPAFAEPDILEQDKQRQQIEAQRVEQEVLTADKNASQIGRTDPARAVEILRNAQKLLEVDDSLSAEKKASLKRKVELSLRAFEGRASDRTNPAIGAAVGDARRQQEERERQDQAAISRTMRDIRDLQAQGRSSDAARLQDDLRRRYPNNPAMIAGSTIGRANDVLASGREAIGRKNDGYLGASNSIANSATPVTEPYNLPANWRELSERRSKGGPQLTAGERAILKALNTVVSVEFDEKATFEGAIDYLSKTIGQPIIITPGSLMEAQVTGETPVKLKADRVTMRTVLKKLLAEVGLTYVIKDQAIQIMSVARAKETMTTRAYYVGDLVQVVDLRFGPVGNQLQMIDNVNRIMAMIVQSVDPMSWDVNNGPGRIYFDPITMSIVVRQSAEVHMMLGVGLR
jgi:hypothetical protein